MNSLELRQQRVAVYRQMAALMLQDTGKGDPELKEQYDALAQQYIDLTRQIKELE